MKKLYFLSFLLFYVAFSQAQISITTINTPHSENFDSMTATGTTLPSNWAAIKQDGTTIAPVVYTTTSNSGAVYNAGTAAATDRCLGSLASASTIPTFGTRFVNNTGATITQISISGIAEQWRSGSDATANESLVFSYSTDATAINSSSTWTPVTGLNINEINTTTTSAVGIDGNLTSNRASFTNTVNLIWPNGSTLWIKWTDSNDGGNDGILALDDFSFTATTVSSSPMLSISSPTNSTVYSPITTSANISLSISNFIVGNPGAGIDGHIHYKLNGVDQPMKYDTAPIALTSLAPGNYTVYVELVNNSHVPISPAVNATVTFTIAAYNVVTDLAALRADVVANGAGKYYQVSSNPVITYARSSTYRNQKYIQDSGAGILIDDVTGIISTPMVAGVAISGLKGQTSLFNGVLQLLPVENATVFSSGNTITPQIVTAADISANIEMYESKLVQINNATFTAANGTVVFATNTNNNLNDGSTIVFRTMFAEADYIGQVIPQGAANRVVLVAEFNNGTTSVAQVVARSLADVNLSSSSFDNINGLTMYPNPLSGNTLYLTSTANAAMSVQIFDLLGKEVMKANVVNNAVNVAKLTAGVYVVKITEEGKTATRKLVIK
jgi:hypothetical protein